MTHSKFMYMLNNHNSVLGIREIAREKGATIQFVRDEEDIFHGKTELQTCNGPTLFAYSPECNATGEKISPGLSKQIQKHNNVYVLLDASKYVATNFLDLSKRENQADFIVFSAYKVFGYPMGIGALLVKNSSSHLLKKSYFGGGTVEFSTADLQRHKLRTTLHEAFEDGTLPYLNIIALNHALKIVPRLISGGISSDEHYMQIVQKHTFYLANKLYSQLSELKHFNGSSVCVFYDKHYTHDMNQQGSIVNFNLKRSSGRFVGYGEVSQAASLNSPQINLRTGCFCNPGACQTKLGMSGETVLDNYGKGHVCWDGNDIINDKPTGSVRLSFGWMSTESDVETFVKFVKFFFVETEAMAKTPELATSTITAKITHLIIYPVKSCQGMSVTDWEICESGPLYDREWTIINTQGVALQQKLYPQMASIETNINLRTRKLIISNCRNPDQPDLFISLDEYPEETISKHNLNVCGKDTKGLIYSDPAVSEWLSSVIGEEVSLVRKSPETDRFMQSDKSGEKSLCKINFSNEAQFLLVNRSSLDDLNRRLKDIYLSSSERHDYSGCHYSNSDWLITRFRPNIVIENKINPRAFEEDHYSKATIGNDLTLNVAGPCNRCSMICIDPISLTKYSEPLKTLFTYRRDSKGRVLFGILLSQQSQAKRITVGSSITLS